MSSTVGHSLTATASATSTATTAATSPPIAVVIHAIVAAIGFAGLLPLGMLWARYARTFVSQWFLVHWIIEFWIGLPFCLVGWGLGFYIDNIVPIKSDTIHTKVGSVVGYLVIAQWILGFVIHYVKPARGWTKRPIQNYIHGSLGFLIICVAFYTVYSGFALQLPASTGVNAPSGMKTLLGAWIAVILICYLSGLALLRRQFRQEAQRRVVAPQEQEYFMAPRDPQ